MKKTLDTDFSSLNGPKAANNIFHKVFGENFGKDSKDKGR